MNYPVYSSPLLACVQKLVQERPATITMRALAAEIGRTPEWLSGFACGKMPGAQATTVEHLYTRLTGKQLVGTCEPVTERTP